MGDGEGAREGSQVWSHQRLLLPQLHLSTAAVRHCNGTREMTTPHPIPLSHPDLDRTLARLAAAVEGGGTGRDAAGVVLYEDAARRRVGMAAAALRGLEDLAKAVAAFDGECDSQQGMGMNGDGNGCTRAAACDCAMATGVDAALCLPLSNPS